MLMPYNIIFLYFWRELWMFYEKSAVENIFY